MPLWLRSGFAERLSEILGEPEPDSFSSASEGMVRLSLGREAAPFELPVSLRLGAAKSCDTEVVVMARVGCEVIGRDEFEDG